MNPLEHHVELHVDRPATLSGTSLPAVLVAQFLSALGDNALLFAALAVLREGHFPGWSVPVLQETFVAAYIVLAPFAGPLADALPKGRVMLLANGLKLCGTLAMALGANPFLAYGLVGIGAAAYSPAKYGILSELVAPRQLVAANSLMEGSTIAAILLGAIGGGLLADRGVAPALAAVLACYGLAMLANLRVPRLPAARAAQGLAPGAQWRDFLQALSTLGRDADARFSLAGTSLFWGAGATLRFLLIAWVPVALGAAGTTLPALLNGVVALGIVAGAALAARTVRLAQVGRAVPAGALLGLCVVALSAVHQLGWAIGLLAVLGACGGYFVVPLNALLQERGHATVGAGHAVAVQNLAENGAMLAMIGAYAATVRAGVPAATAAAGFGALLVIGMGGLWLARARTAHSRGDRPCG